MSKVYKSSCISIGTPKPIINVFVSEKKQREDKDTIINNENNSSDLKEEADSIIEDAKQMYLKIIEEANNEARKILEAAESEAQNILLASKEQGYKEGFESGHLEGTKEAQSIIDEASKVRGFLDKRKESLYKETEEQLVQLILNVSKKVIGEELTQNKEAILSLVNQALQKCAFKKKLILKTSPIDFDFIIQSKDKICTMVEGILDIDIVSDLSLTQGSCIIETPSGEINSSIDVQIKEIENVFTYLLRNE